MDMTVKQILESAFPNAIVELEHLASGRLSGRIIWDGYAELDDLDRQDLIRSVLEERLGHDAATVGIVLTYTPHELEVMLAA